MKRIFRSGLKNLTVLCFVFISVAALAQEKFVSSKVSQVKIYANGAEISRNAKVFLPRGTTMLIFDGIANEITPSSIRFSASKGVEILSIGHNVNNQKPDYSNPVIKKLIDSLNLMNDYIKNIEIQNNVMSTEETILKSNQTLGGNQQGFNSAELLKLLELNRSRLTEIQTQKYANNKKLNDAREIVNRLNQSITKEKKQLPTSKGEIKVMVSAETNINADFELKYFATNAYWQPVYDIKTDGPGSKTTLTYKAEVAQWTGEIWDNIKLSISSASPQTGINFPFLKTEYVDFNKPAPPIVGYRKQNAPKIQGSRADAEMGYFNDGVEMASPLKSIVNSLENIFEFDIPNPFSIPNDGEGKIISLKEYNLDVEFEYYSIPKLESSVFLTGIATNWKGYNLLPGNANMYLGETYAGLFFLNTNTSEDSLRLSFGRDKQISIERKLLNDFSKKSFFGNNQKQTYSYEFVINNARNAEINFKLIDQIPISKESEIKVESDELSGGTLNTNNGFVEWEFKMKAKENRKIKFSYTISFPKSKEIYKQIEK